LQIQGILKNGTVAVKKLSNTYMYHEKLQQEVGCLMKVRHTNVVRFLGYCADTQGKMESYNGKLVMADVQLNYIYKTFWKLFPTAFTSSLHKHKLSHLIDR
jgi:serine/threonine protein kinase